MIICSDEMASVAKLLASQVAGARQIYSSGELNREKRNFRKVDIQSGNLAMLQYTSGSTGDPKGVMLTHANLLANIRAMATAIEATTQDVFVSWLPLYHDMGLIGAWLGSFTVGFRLAEMPMGSIGRSQLPARP
jgi:acyl-CoA synthetase (AMP-forming)/AMP-acid ligase II